MVIYSRMLKYIYIFLRRLLCAPTLNKILKKNKQLINHIHQSRPSHTTLKFHLAFSHLTHIEKA